MKEQFPVPISAVATSPVQNDVVVIGFFDGLIKCCTLGRSDIGKLTFLEVWTNRLKGGVRGLTFSNDGANIYAICENRALVIFDIEGTRLRCIKRSHEKTRPHRVSALPDTARYAAATGGDNGEIVLWDFNSTNPIVTSFNDQTDSINALIPFKATTLLAASSDATLTAYDFRQQKKRLQSETMHSELLSIVILDKFTCVGSGDGTIEIFNNAEFGNIIGRLKTDHTMGVDAMIELDPCLIISSSCMSDELQFFKINPNKTLESIPHEGGADIFAKTCDDKYLIFTATDTTTIYVRRLVDLVRESEEGPTQQDLFTFH